MSKRRGEPSVSVVENESGRIVIRARRDPLSSPSLSSTSSPSRPAPSQTPVHREPLVSPSPTPSEVPMEDDEDDTTPTPRRGRPTSSSSSTLRPEIREAAARAADGAAQLGVDCPSFYSFKNQDWMIKKINLLGPGRTWRGYKQVIERENYHMFPSADANFVSIRAQPSALPNRKYCDLSGFPARYTDPSTKLYYHAAPEYAYIQSLSTDRVRALLQLRGYATSHHLLLRS